jgi:hypothetical protein
MGTIAHGSSPQVSDVLDFPKDQSDYMANERNPWF